MGRLIRINKKRRALAAAVEAALPKLVPTQQEIVIAPNPTDLEKQEPTPVVEPAPVDPHAGLFREVTLTENEAGSTRTIIAGGDAYFQLRENSEEASLKWVVAEKPDNFRLTTESKREFEDKPLTIRIFQFEVRKGEGKVVFHLKNPWRAYEPVKTVEFTVIGV